MQFISEKEVEEVKAKRQKEWEKVRRPDQPLGEYDTRLGDRFLAFLIRQQSGQRSP